MKTWRVGVIVLLSIIALAVDKAGAKLKQAKERIMRLFFIIIAALWLLGCEAGTPEPEPGPTPEPTATVGPAPTETSFNAARDYIIAPGTVVTVNDPINIIVTGDAGDSLFESASAKSIVFTFAPLK